MNDVAAQNLGTMLVIGKIFAIAIPIIIIFLIIDISILKSKYRKLHDRLVDKFGPDFFTEELDEGSDDKTPYTDTEPQTPKKIIKCPKCGADIEEETVMCDKCGALLE